MFGREGHPTPLGAAFAEYGRIDKTMHLLALVDPVDDTYRRLRTSPASPRSRTGTSTSWAATCSTSNPAAPGMACARCATRTPPTTSSREAGLQVSEWPGGRAFLS
jgi:hypothetical protein